ncbi:MAG: tetratricopeptide repeat protein [Gammaproteobacteria bacterium]|nr:tetratricopeptide repeat protein [Gammaproteobacteria bacterium]
MAGTAPINAQPDAEARFREANALFRSGIYYTAIARYREAAAAGLDTPLLHYNVGVVSYKLGQYEEAERSFRRAQTNPDLAALAGYNLGLTYRQLGRRADAEAAFRAAASTSRKSELADLASRAASSLAALPERSASDRRDDQRRARRPEPEPIGGLRVLMSARLGQDDNIYRTPSEPYVDLAAAGQPLVTPIVESSSFVPVDVLAEYSVPNEAEDTLFRVGYRLDADFYEAEFSNADRVFQRLEFGADIDLSGESQRRRRLQSAFYLTDYFQSNFDPDDGFDREVSGEDISERFWYKGAGIETDFDHDLGRWTYGFDLRLEGRQYKRVPFVANYDHNLSFVRARAAYSLTDRMMVEFGLLKYRRVYDERLARDLNGSFLTTNEPLEYDYSGMELGVSYKIGRPFEIGVSYSRLDRRDMFVGYYDYTQDYIRLRATYRPTARLRFSAIVRSRVYDYPNAFVFNDPAAGPQELDDISAEIRGEFQFTSRWLAWAELVTMDVTSTDPRLGYMRNQSMFGVLWRL